MGVLKKLKKYKWIIGTVMKAPWSLKKKLIAGVRHKKDNYYPPDYEERHADFKNLIYCMLCPNMCRFECPVVNATKTEKHAPAGKSWIAYYLEMGRLAPTDENVMPLFEGCAHCDACKEWCPFDFSVGDLLEGVAADLYDQDALPPAVKQLTAQVREHDGLYDAKQYAAASKPLRDMKLGEVYYFPGCVTMAHHPKTIESIAKIAEKAGTSLVADPDSRVCCGAPSIYAGDLEGATRLAQTNADFIQQLSVKKIVCECPECTHALREQYPKLGVDLGVPVVHVTEWIADLLAEGKIKLAPSDEPGVSYHDPCVLARKLGNTRFPRKILQALFPETFVEVPYNQKETHCCGYGGVVNVVAPETAGIMAKKRLAEFRQVGAKTLVTCCPTCELSFLKYDEAVEFEVRDLVDLVAEHLK